MEPTPEELAQWQIDAERTRKKRQLNLQRGWHPRGWTGPERKLEQLDEQFRSYMEPGPDELRDLSHPSDPDAALKWLARHLPVQEGP